MGDIAIAGVLGEKFIEHHRCRGGLQLDELQIIRIGFYTLSVKKRSKAVLWIMVVAFSERKALADATPGRKKPRPGGWKIKGQSPSMSDRDEQGDVGLRRANTDRVR